MNILDLNDSSYHSLTPMPNSEISLYMLNPKAPAHLLPCPVVIAAQHEDDKLMHLVYNLELILRQQSKNIRSN